MPTKTRGEHVKVVSFGSHGGPVAGSPFGEINGTDHVASTPSNLSNNPHRPPAKMSVVLNPNRNLGFRRPLTQVAKRSLTITNANSQPVAFKVKTTAPKLYCVRPNSGRVEPGESVDVSVMLQPLKEEPPLNSKCKDKFLVQSTVITPEKETMALHDLWSSPEMNDEGVVHQQKLRVLYLPAEEQPLEEEDENAPAIASQNLGPSELNPRFITTKTNANGHPHPGIPDFTEPTQPVPHDTDTLIQAPAAAPPPVPPVANEHISREHSDEVPQVTYEIPPVPPQPHEAPIEDDSAYQPPLPEDLEPPHNQYEEPEPLPVPPPVHVPPPPSTIETVYVTNPLNEELLAKYKDAQAEIDRLRANIATMSVAPASELRSRRARTNSDAGSTAETDIQTVIEEPSYHHQDGVPLQVVVIIALGVFITTYLFF